MAEPRTNVVAPKTGEIGSIPESKITRAREAGARRLSDEEANVIVNERERAHDVPAIGKAFGIGAARGLGETVGVSTDEAALGIASLYGQDSQRQAQNYLRSLSEEHPLASAGGELWGNLAGAAAETAFTEGGAAEETAPGVAAAFARVARAAGRSAVRGGVENLVTGSTHDVNEQALGKPDAAGEKLYAKYPKHFAVGAGVGAVFGGGFQAAGEGLSALGRKAAPGLDRAASGLVGREVGETGEAAVSAGEHVRGLKGGAVPKDRAEIVSLLENEQAALREQADRGYASTLDAVAGEQQRTAGRLSLAQEAARKSTLARGAQGVTRASEEGARSVAEAETRRAESLLDIMGREGGKVEEAELAASRMRSGTPADLHYAVSTSAQEVNRTMEHFADMGERLSAERKTAQELAERLGEERAANAKELEAAIRESEGGGYDIDEILGAMGRKNDPVTGWALEQSLRDAGQRIAGDAFSEAEALHVERLRSMSAALEASHKQALDHVASLEIAQASLQKEAQQEIRRVGRLADQQIAAFQKTRARDLETAEGAIEKARTSGLKAVEAETKRGDNLVESARSGGERLAADARKAGEKEATAFEKGAEAERKSLGKAQAAETKAVPKPTGETPVDSMLDKAQARAAEKAPLVSPNASLGAMFSVMHGNIPAAAGALIGSFAAGRARAEGNLIAARALRNLSGELTQIDKAVRKGAGSVVGSGAASYALAVDRAKDNVDNAPKRESLSFEKVSKAVRDGEGNPLLIESRVRQQMGMWAMQAPQVYSSVLMAAERAQAFLASKLPEGYRDPHSLTPHLEEPYISEAEKYDFMVYVKTIDAPLEVFGDVKSGTVTEQQIEALEVVYPTLFSQMKAEVERAKNGLEKPMPYERSIHVGTLLGVVTDDVLEPAFQGALAASYEEKAEAGQPVGSKKPSADSKVGRDYMSASQRVERGE